MNTPLLQAAAQALIYQWDTADWKSTKHIAEYVNALRKALEAEQVQGVEPVTDEENERFSQNVGNFNGADPEATKYALDEFLKNRSAPPLPAGKQVNWQDMYLKQKSEKEAMAAKYEKDIGPLAKMTPATGECAELIQWVREFVGMEFSPHSTEAKKLCKAADMLEAAKREPLSLDYIDSHIGTDEDDREAVVEIVREVERAHEITPQGDTL